MKNNCNTILARLGGKNPKSASIPKNIPITMSSVFSFEDIETLDDVYEGRKEGYVYTRMMNPVHEALSEMMFTIDGGEDAQVFSSGMSAITMSILTQVNPGDHIIASNVLYGESYIFLKYELSKYNIEVSFIDIEKDSLENHYKENTKVVYIETISNPLIAITDIKSVCKSAHNHGAIVMIDNTFATPVVCRPIELGVDIVIYSATKFICGHGDVTGGIVVSNKEIIKNIRAKATLYGTIMSPFDSWLLVRSLKTLGVRMKQHSSNALKLAEYFESNPKINAVFYPGLKSSKYHKIANEIFTGNGYGGMLTIDIKAGEKAAYKVIDSLENIQFVPSLADIETTVCCPSKTSHRDMTDEELENAGISKALIRISAGLEDVEDLISEFEKVLKSI